MNEVLPEILFYEIYNTSGTLLAKKQPTSNIEEYNLQDQVNGLYIARIYYKDGNVEVKKVILIQ